MFLTYFIYVGHNSFNLMFFVLLPPTINKLCYVMLCYVMLCYVMLCYVMLF